MKFVLTKLVFFKKEGFPISANFLGPTSHLSPRNFDICAVSSPNHHSLRSTSAFCKLRQAPAELSPISPFTCRQITIHSVQLLLFATNWDKHQQSRHSYPAFTNFTNQFAKLPQTSHIYVDLQHVLWYMSDCLVLQRHLENSRRRVGGEWGGGGGWEEQQAREMRDMRDIQVSHVRAIWGTFEGHMRVLWGPYEVHMRDIEGHMRDICGPYEGHIRPYKGHMRAILGPYEGHMRDIWGTYEGHMRDSYLLSHVTCHLSPVTWHEGHPGENLCRISLITFHLMQRKQLSLAILNWFSLVQLSSSQKLFLR